MALSNDEKFERAVELLNTTTLSQRSVAEKVGLAESSLRYKLARRAQQRAQASAEQAPGVRRNDDGSATIVANKTAESWTPESLLEAHGLEPDEWEIIRVRGNRWGDPDDPNHQLRIDVVPRESLVLPAALEPVEFGSLVKPAPDGGVDFGSKTIVVVGDQHCPLHDRTLHKLFVQFLLDEQPAEGVLLGDILDFTEISRHRTRPGFTQTVNDTIQSAFEVLRDYRLASPDTRWRLLRGNHDDRLEHAILDNNEKLYGITAADEEIPALSLKRLLHLDELGIELVDEDWDRAKTPVTTSLSARHGYMTSEGTGRQMLNKHSNSQIQGHSHRMRFSYRTQHDPIDVRVAIEAGTMAQIHEGLGYADEPDWQQGFVYGTAWDDGDFALAPAIYVDGRLLLPDGRRYTDGSK